MGMPRGVNGFHRYAALLASEYCSRAFDNLLKIRIGEYGLWFFSRNRGRFWRRVFG